jgi:hypothetical protein
MRLEESRGAAEVGDAPGPAVADLARQNFAGSFVGADVRTLERNVNDDKARAARMVNLILV